MCESQSSQAVVLHVSVVNEACPEPLVLKFELTKAVHWLLFESFGSTLDSYAC